MKLVPIEYKTKRVLITAQLAESYGTDSIKITQNFNNNKYRYIPGKHYFLLQGKDLQEFKSNIEIFDIATNANKIYLWTEKGAWLHAKSLNTDQAWEAYEMLVDEYYRVKDILPDTDQLSPMLQELIQIELRQNQLEQRIGNTENTLTLVKDTLIQHDENWRNYINSMLNKVAKDSREYAQVKRDSYKMLEDRARCDLNARLRNLKARLKSHGATKTKTNQANRLDVIENDVRLKEIYTSIVKEMTIAHVV